MYAPSIETLSQLLIETGKDELLSRYTRVEGRLKDDGSIITEADLAAQQRIEKTLYKCYPDIGFLAEEMTTSDQQSALLSGKPVWCLDPLDGTSNFAAGIPVFSISLALIEDGRATYGVVVDPFRKECFYGIKGEGSFLNGLRLGNSNTVIDLNQCTGLIDFKRLPADLCERLLTEPPYSSQRSFGSVALDWCWLAAGRCHIYLHGKQNLWDYAAGNLIFHEAGGHSCTLQGDPVFINQLIPRSAVGALDIKLFKKWTNWLGVEGMNSYHDNVGKYQ